jgi:hypothetical protein
MPVARLAGKRAIAGRHQSRTLGGAYDHCSAECVGIHAALRATRFEAFEPIRHGVRQHFGGFTKGLARGLSVRHDHRTDGDAGRGATGGGSSDTSR